ncbi:MAG: hypothetical protein ABIS18_00940 [Actinomycetota bacterium]
MSKSSTSSGRFSDRSIVIFKLVASVAIFAGGSALAFGALAQKQADDQGPKWISWEDPESSSEEGPSESGFIGEGSVGDFLAGLGLGASNATAPETLAVAEPTKKARTSATAPIRLVSQAPVASQVPSNQAPSQPAEPTSGPSSNPNPQPTSQPTSQPTPQPSPSPTTEDPNLSAGPVFSAVETAKSTVGAFVAGIQYVVLKALGYDHVPGATEVINSLPSLPSLNDAPGVPGVPTPGTPDVSGLVPEDLPEAPQAPGAPAVPGAPATPGLPQTPGGPDGQALFDQAKALVATVVDAVKSALMTIFGVDADNPPTPADLTGDVTDAIADPLKNATDAVANGLLAAGEAAATLSMTAEEGAATAEETVATTTAQALSAGEQAQADAAAAAAQAEADAAIARAEVEKTAADAAAAAQEQAKNLPPALVGTVVVNVSNKDGSSFPTIEGHEYLLKASGKYFYGAGAYQADALCAQVPGTWLEDAFPASPGLLNLTINGAIVPWGGTCSATHKYEQRFTASTGLTMFAVKDDSYANNTNDTTDLLKVEIYDLTPAGASGAGVANNPVTMVLAVMLLLGSLGEAINLRRARGHGPVLTTAIK